MKFASAGKLIEFAGALHPKAREKALLFDSFCIGEGMGESFVTSVSRRADFYANGKFSWHLVDCAVDFRNKHLSERQLLLCEEWLRAECASSEWELVTKPHGTGPHFHLAYKSYSLRKRFGRNGHGGEETPPTKE